MMTSNQKVKRGNQWLDVYPRSYAQLINREFASKSAEQSFLDIEQLIPTTASVTNKLADQNFVNSSVTNLAAFKVFIDAQQHDFATAADLRTAISLGTFYRADGILYTPSTNDYAVVLSDEERDPNSAYYQQTTRWKLFSNGVWGYDFPLGRQFTAAEFAALHSGATTEIIQSIENKADRVSGMSEGNFFASDSYGNLADSGVSKSAIIKVYYITGSLNATSTFSINDPSLVPGSIFCISTGPSSGVRVTSSNAYCTINGIRCSLRKVSATYMALDSGASVTAYNPIVISSNSLIFFRFSGTNVYVRDYAGSSLQVLSHANSTQGVMTTDGNYSYSIANGATGTYLGADGRTFKRVQYSEIEGTPPAPPTATNTTLGLVKGSTDSGKVNIAADGTMTVNGGVSSPTSFFHVIRIEGSDGTHKIYATMYFPSNDPTPITASTLSAALYPAHSGGWYGISGEVVYSDGVTSPTETIAIIAFVAGSITIVTRGANDTTINVTIPTATGFTAFNDKPIPIG